LRRARWDGGVLNGDGQRQQSGENGPKQRRFKAAVEVRWLVRASMRLQLEEEMGDEGRSTAEGDDGLGRKLIEGSSRWLHFWWRRHASSCRLWT
jgi:hypothetical protein